MQNLNEKLKKEELKRSLYALFSQYGRIFNIVALKTAKLRGQKWIQYANMSDCVAKADGTFVARDGEKKQDEKAERKRLVEEAQQCTTANRRTDINGGQTRTVGACAVEASLGKPGTHESATTPKKILLIQNLPHETTSMMLPALFQQYPGFREVRMIEAKPGIAFVEFEDDVQSSVAMQALQGFKITPQNPMAVTYAKK
ncbi:unnamed protein product [Camellia sinensis]